MIKDAPVTVRNTGPTGEGPTVTTEVPEPTAEDPRVTNDAPVTAKDPKPSAQEPSVSDSTPEATATAVTEPKKSTKADLAKAIYDEMVMSNSPRRCGKAGIGGPERQLRRRSGNSLLQGPPPLGPEPVPSPQIRFSSGSGWEAHAPIFTGCV